MPAGFRGRCSRLTLVVAVPALHVAVVVPQVPGKASLRPTSSVGLTDVGHAFATWRSGMVWGSYTEGSE